MKKKRIIYAILLCLATVVPVSFLSSCSDNVDDSNLYTFTGETMIDYISTQEDLSSFKMILSKVKLNNLSQSTLDQLLSTRGHYTCFAPTNEAIQLFLDSIYDQKDYDIHNVPDSTASDIAKSCIIDNKDNEAYLTTSFVGSGALEKTNLDDRYITIDFDTIHGGIRVNAKSRIIAKDIEVENGVVHKLDRVLAPSNAALPSLMEQIENIKIFSRLLQETGLAAQMTKYRDEVYEKWVLLNPKGKGCPTQSGGALIDNPAHRNYGFTAFVESDATLENKWGIKITVNPTNGNITNWDQEILNVIKEKCSAYYPDADPNAPLTSPENPVNQFVSYHLLKAAIPFNKLVIHYSEIGYAYTKTDLAINAWEYYETMGKGRRLMKITEGITTNGKRINRNSQYELEKYTEISDNGRPGVLINSNNGNYDNNSLNGYYYLIDDVLVYDKDVPNKILNERMRYDLCALLPEMVTNGLRRISEYKDFHFKEDYFDNFRFSKETLPTYLSGYGAGWKDFQGDEFNITGQYDITLRLPAVPLTGTYELRYGLNINDQRGMAQIYFGENPKNLSAIGLPIDIRLQMKTTLTGWVKDGEDPMINNENDKNLKNHGYLKSPMYFGFSSTTGTTKSFRNEGATDDGSSNAAVRKVIWTGMMEAGKTYYVRFKSVLKSTNTQLFFDYLEIVPKSVYNGAEVEDKW
ncbi:MAG: fasciclin domain-containing protein [Bacteroidaceae bacterium]